MFWRRRKLPEDDEPLVPHGLIWQATEAEDSTELPPDMWDNSPKDLDQSPAEPVEMPVRISARTEPRSVENPAASDPNQIVSPPVRWPRLDDAEMARRAQLVDTAVSFPYRQPLVGSAVPKPIESEPVTQIAEPAKLELVSVSPSTPIRMARSERFRGLISKVRGLRLPSLAPAWQRVRSADVLSKIKDGISSGLEATSQGLSVLRQKSGAALSAARMTFADHSRAALSQSRSGLEHLRRHIVGVDLSGLARLRGRARSLRIVVRIPASNRHWIASLAESARASRLRAQQVLQRDSRLWGSLAMAALSALLALGVISGLRHYVTESGTAQPAPRTVQASTSAPRGEMPAPAKASREITGNKPSPIAASAKAHAVSAQTPTVATQRKVSPAVSHKKPRRRNTDEDDYVAKNTYVFYGNAGKPRR